MIMNWLKRNKLYTEHIVDLMIVTASVVLMPSHTIDFLYRKNLHKESKIMTQIRKINVIAWLFRWILYNNGYVQYIIEFTKTFVTKQYKTNLPLLLWLKKSNVFKTETIQIRTNNKKNICMMPPILTNNVRQKHKLHKLQYKKQTAIKYDLLKCCLDVTRLHCRVMCCSEKWLIRLNYSFSLLVIFW